MKTLVLVSALMLIVGCSAPAGDRPTSEATELSSPAPIPMASVEPAQQRKLPLILAPVPTAFRALGTEPFWSAVVADRTLTYSTPDLPDGATTTVSRKDVGAGVVYTGTIDGKPLELEVRRETCSDGMSDTVYPYMVVRKIGPDTQRGCAR